MEACADEILGPMSRSKYDLLLSKLAGTRGNRVFSFFGIEAPQRAAEALVAAQKAASKTGGVASATAMLEKKKRKKGGSGPGLAKRSKLLDFLSSSLWQNHFELHQFECAMHLNRYNYWSVG